jgi:flagellin
MNSILTNSAALSALQSLNMTQNEMNITQNQVSTGLAVATAADNAAYWAIGQQLNSDNGLVTTSNTALAQSQAMLDTANSAIQSVITTIDAIQSALSEAANPGASLSNINTTLASLSNQLTTTINGASFNGVNLLNGSQTSMSFISGYDASSTGGSVSTISLTAQSLLGGQNSVSAGSASTAVAVTDPNLISALETATATGNVTLPGNGQVVVTSTDAYGDISTSTYQGFSTSGVDATTNTAYSATNTTGAASWTVTNTTSTVLGSPSGMLIQTGTTLLGNQYNLSQLGSGTNGTAVTLANANDMLSAVNAALAAVTTYAATIGATQDTMTAAATFNSALGTDYTNGVSALVDADMNTASTKLQALQTQEQLGIQSLSIANQNSQLILKLFNG